MSGFTCSECHWHGEDPARITLHSLPDMGEFSLVVCPECRHLKNSLEQCCDEPDCKLTVSQGWPTADGGYRQTCHLHGPKYDPA